MKKRFLALFLTFVMVLTLLPTAAFAADDGGFTIEDGILTAYNGPGGDVVIPEGVTGFSGPRRPDDDEVSEYFADSPWEAPIWGTGLCGVFEGNQTITKVQTCERSVVAVGLRPLGAMLSSAAKT